MKRRDCITLLAGAAVTLPTAARAQQAGQQRRIGLVMAYAEDDVNGQQQVAAFKEQLQKLGWSEGNSIQIEVRYAADDPAVIKAFAKELLRLQSELIVSNSNQVTAILKSEVHSVPLVFVSVSDPIGSGFVTDLARPNGNVTGFANFQASMGGKWLEELREIAPQVERVGMVMYPEPPNFGYFKSAEAAAPLLKVKLVDLKVQNGADIERAIAAFANEPHSGLIVAPNIVTFANSGLIVELAARNRLPTIYPFAFFARAGGLISYGFDAYDQFRQGAIYVDKILRGAKPSDLPVQHPTKFQVVINMKAAKALGLEVPSQLQQLADEIIE
jgi:putative tryptophan/tyrosine transport system substrate-binding protein